VSSLGPQNARTAYLNGLSAEDQSAVLRRAETDGPFSTSPDWLIIQAATESATSIKEALNHSNAHFDVLTGRMEEATKAAGRIESAVSRFEIASRQAQANVNVQEVPRVATSAPSQGHTPNGLIFAFGAAMATFSGIVVLVEWVPAAHVYTVALYGAGVTVGVVGAVVYQKAWNYFVKPSGRRR